MAAEPYQKTHDTTDAMAAEAEFVTAPSTPDSLEIVVEQRLRQHDDGEGGSSSLTMTIFRVPAHVRDANRDLYEPRLVSIGPYYRGRPALRAMEQHKWRCLRELLALNPAASSADCVRAVRAVEHRARRFYSEQTDIFAAAAAVQGDGVIGDGQSGDGGNNPPGRDDFGEMLLLDACFVLNFFIKWHNEEQDELCDVGWGLPLLQSDLLLLENQIPIFVLEAPFRLVSPQAEAWHHRRLILPHLRLSKQLSPAEEERATRAKEIHHLLHLLYEAIVPSAEEMAAAAAAHASPGAGTGTTPPRPAPRCVVVVRRLRQVGGRVSKAVSERFAFVRRTMPQLPLPLPRWPWMSRLSSLLRQGTAPACAWLSERTARMGRRTAAAEAEAAPPMVVPSVTLLREAGVRFGRKASPRHMFDAAAGVVSMPRLEVDHANRPVLVNLAALEQTTTLLRGRGGGGGANADKPVSSYAALVSSLVRAGADVEHLQKRGVVDNLLGSDDGAAAEFFQRLGDCGSLDYEDHHLAAMFAELSRYYHSSWRRHKARFLREHCSSPWAVLALIFAGCAFCVALVKFSTTIYGLTHPNCRC